MTDNEEFNLIFKMGTAMEEGISPILHKHICCDCPFELRAMCIKETAYCLEIMQFFDAIMKFTRTEMMPMLSSAIAHHKADMGSNNR